MIGGLGISGGTGEEDHSLAEYGQSVSAGINIGNLPCLSYSAELFQMYLIKRIVISSGHLPGGKCSGLFFIFAYISRESCLCIS